MSENEAERGAKDEEVRNLNVAQLAILKMVQTTLPTLSAILMYRVFCVGRQVTNLKKKVESQTGLAPP